MTVVILSLAVASISFLVTETKLLLPLREWVKRKNRFLGELLSCGYCFGHWVALAGVGLYRPRLLDAWGPVDFILTVFILAWLAGFQWALMCLVMEKAGK